MSCRLSLVLLRPDGLLVKILRSLGLRMSFFLLPGLTAPPPPRLLSGLSSMYLWLTGLEVPRLGLISRFFLPEELEFLELFLSSFCIILFACLLGRI